MYEILLWDSDSTTEQGINRCTGLRAFCLPVWVNISEQHKPFSSALL